MHGNDITALVLVAILLTAGIWDIYALFWLGPGSTVSAVIMMWSTRFPVIPLLVGILIGHLFWPSVGGPGKE